MFVLSCENLSRLSLGSDSLEQYYANELTMCKPLDSSQIILWLFFQRQDEEAEYEYDYSEQDESEAALGLPSDSISIRENIGTQSVNYPQIFKA